MILEIGVVRSTLNSMTITTTNRGGGVRSLDLLVKFVSNVFKKVSKRARKAVRSVLPVPLSTKLVEFSVNEVLLLAFLWVLKAFLEAILGGFAPLEVWCLQASYLGTEE
ncbi:protein SHORT HYPOCOTYL IN WHITE LIGHT 1-like [Populus nigra]|uniref:protein SHORT HYPOCOTYL IN WHITE LIGHT 1-like n=1 Tax=Populus nigra TaxID=3691 RepID=UPI002B266E68|nr:protein SHORT HYPOCOTYL IN WHITE LIGHT 1-like [Populus nigra]